MAGKLITLPLRVSFQSARLLTHVAGAATGRALSLAGRTIGVVAPGRAKPEHPHAASASPKAPAERTVAETPPPETPPRETPSVRPVPSMRTPTPPTAPPPPEAATPDEPAPLVEEPLHVSEEPELVREEAEPGAEDGAGAAINVMEPWRGYAHMSAKDVIARARSANRAELAAVRLYESRHRSRQTVLAAVDRQLKLSNGGAPA